jgi:hypothetical protein
LNTEAHAHSVNTKKDKESNQAAVEHSMQEESAMDENMDFVMLSSITKPAVTATTRVSKPSVEEQEMWDNYEFSGETFSAGIDPALAVVEERKRLEQEATDFDLWRGYDFVPEEDPNDGEQLLDELEQEDILNELLRNARMYYRSIVLVFNAYHIF